MKRTALLIITGLFTYSAVADNKLTIVTYGGSSGAGLNEAAMKPFTQKTGVTITAEDFSGGIAQLKAQVDSRNVIWDVMDMELPDAVRACNAGLFEGVVPDRDLSPAPDGTPPSKDFINGALGDCFVANHVWATAVAYNTTAFKGEQPSALTDFFDLKRFPGKRGLRKAPQANLEWALLADGVPREKVYAALETEEGLNRAFAKLDTIKSQVIWWEAGAQPPQLLADGQVVMTSAWNGRIWAAQTKEKQPFKVIWDGQMYDMDVWAIPKGTKNLKQAMEFLRFATETKTLANFSHYIAYGPTRQSSQEFVAEETKADLPTFPANFSKAMQVDSVWWGDHADEINERFSTWLAK